MNSKEDLKTFFKKRLGLELADQESEDIWQELNKQAITSISKGDGNNIAFTPAKLQSLINLALDRTGSTLQNPHFKKVSEEMMPALTFSLFLKKLGRGEHLIVSSDEPDIVLVKMGSVEKHKLEAFPLEAMFINQYGIAAATGTNAEEKIANLIISKKFTKAYIPQTMLLVTINLDSVTINMQEIRKFLLIHKNTLNQVWIFLISNQGHISFIRMLPDFEIYDIGTADELKLLMH